ncbi:MAG: hemolysin family protein [bacterium]|nr:hemolysin family protein [bacterium]
MPDMLIWLLVLLLLSVTFFCTLGSGALQSIPLERLWRLREGGGRTAAGVEYWITHAQQITWSFRVVSRVSCVALALALMTAVSGEILPLYAFLIALIVATLLVALPGSLIPSAWAQMAGERLGLSLLPFIRVFGIVLTPLAAAGRSILNVLLKPFGVPPLTFATIHLKSEVEQCVGGIERSGRLNDEEKKMIRRIFAFGGLEASDIMTPRISFRCVDDGDTIGRAAELLRDEQYSRFPVCSGGTENVVGILHVKDLIAPLALEGGRERPVGEIMRAPIFVPEATKARDLFYEMRKRQGHMAIVVDEYGSATGLVTMEDILERIVGEIRDEYDTGEPKPYEKVAAGVYRVDARLSVSDAREELGLALPDRHEYDTLAGFVCSLLGRVPAAGESISWGGHTIRVLEATDMGVRRLEIRMARR